MKIELTQEEISHLKSLDSKKKKRKFLLDCLVEEIEKKVNPISLSDFLKNQVRTPLDYLNRPDKLYLDSNKAYRGIPQNLKEPQPPIEFCVEVTDGNKEVLQQIWAKRGQAVIGNYLVTNSLNTFLIQNDEPFLWIEDFGKKQLPTVTTEEFLKYIGKEDLINKDLK
jgi:hypothetical protein